MSDKFAGDHLDELRQMIKNKKPKQPVEEILAFFCQRHGVSMETCRLYYRQLVKEGKIKETMV